jgi:hypothetical protein
MLGFAHVLFSHIEVIFSIEAIVEIRLLVVPDAETVQIVVFEVILTSPLEKRLRQVWHSKSAH